MRYVSCSLSGFCFLYSYRGSLQSLCLQAVNTRQEVNIARITSAARCINKRDCKLRDVECENASWVPPQLRE